MYLYTIYTIYMRIYKKNTSLLRGVVAGLPSLPSLPILYGFLLLLFPFSFPSLSVLIFYFIFLSHSSSYTSLSSINLTHLFFPHLFLPFSFLSPFPSISISPPPPPPPFFFRPQSSHSFPSLHPLSSPYSPRVLP